MKIPKKLFLIPLIISINMNAFAQLNVSNNAKTVFKLDFSGVWELDDSLSLFGIIPKTSSSKQIMVNQSPDSIAVTRVGSSVPIQKNDLGGKKTTIYSQKSARTKTSVISWNAQGREMIETAKFSYDVLPKKDFQTGYVDIWSLSPDGKILTIIRSMETDDPKMNWTTKSVYNKQR
ncbi:MAG: hypothetical protein V4687_04555 [Bacteroidota bacterium]